jgi:hypothetical protein
MRVWDLAALEKSYVFFFLPAKLAKRRIHRRVLEGSAFQTSPGQFASGIEFTSHPLANLQRIVVVS